MKYTTDDGRVLYASDLGHITLCDMYDGEMEHDFYEGEDVYSYLKSNKSAVGATPEAQEMLEKFPAHINAAFFDENGEVIYVITDRYNIDRCDNEWDFHNNNADYLHEAGYGYETPGGALLAAEKAFGMNPQCYDNLNQDYIQELDSLPVKGRKSSSLCVLPPKDQCDGQYDIREICSRFACKGPPPGGFSPRRRNC